MTYLEYLHESSNVQLGVQREVVDVRHEGSDLLLEEGELVLERVDGHGIVALVVRIVIVRASVLDCARFTLVPFRVRRGASDRMLSIGVFAGNQPFDCPLSVLYAPCEIGGLFGAI